MPSLLWKMLGVIFVLTGVVAIPAMLQVHRSVPCVGQIRSISESQSQRRDSDGNVELLETSTFHIEFKNPETGAAAQGTLDDIYRKQGDFVHLRYDPRDKSIVLDDPWKIYHSPLWFLGILLVFWMIVVLAVVAK